MRDRKRPTPWQLVVGAVITAVAVSTHQKLFDPANIPGKFKPRPREAIVVEDATEKAARRERERHVEWPGTTRDFESLAPDGKSFEDTLGDLQRRLREVQ